MLSKKLIAVAALALFLGSTMAFAEIKYIQFSGGKIAEVAAAGVKDTCKKNFVYRDVGKEDVADYLSGEIVKAALSGRVISDLKLVTDKMKELGDGTCSWALASEAGKY